VAVSDNEDADDSYCNDSHLSIYYVLYPVLSSPHLLSHLIFILTQRSRKLELAIIAEETEASPISKGPLVLGFPPRSAASIVVAQT
jgi:hypothetical protein